MGVDFPVMWAVIDPITRAVITETRVSTLRLGAAVLLRRGFRPTCLGAAVLAVISPASGAWDSAFWCLVF